MLRIKEAFKNSCSVYHIQAFPVCHSQSGFSFLVSKVCILILKIQRQRAEVHGIEGTREATRSVGVLQLSLELSGWMPWEASKH